MPTETQPSNTSYQVSGPFQGEPVRLNFPTALRKMWSGGEVQDWLDQQAPLYRRVEQQRGNPEGRRERFQKWVLRIKHPVFGYLDGRSLARSDDRTGYADEYVQGLWVAFLEFSTDQSQAPVTLPACKAKLSLSHDWDQGHSEGWKACLDETAKLGPLYTRPAADAGEVERLREALGCALRSAENINAEVISLRVQLTQLISAVRSINFGPQHEIRLNGDDEPQYPQRKEWIEWALELCDQATAALTNKTANLNNLGKLRNLNNLHPSSASEIDMLRAGAITTGSGGGEYFIKLTYRSLADRRLAEVGLRAALAGHSGDVVVAGIDVEQRLGRLIDQLTLATQDTPAPTITSEKH